MWPDAVLTRLPDERAAPPTGHPRPRGALLPKPEALARDDRERWRTCEADLYGQRRTVRYKEMSAQRYRACGVGDARLATPSAHATNPGEGCPTAVSATTPVRGRRFPTTIWADRMRRRPTDSLLRPERE
jgi:hypothetical protein